MIRDCRLMKCTTVPHGCVYHRTSTTHKSWNKMKEKKKKSCMHIHPAQNKLEYHLLKVFDVLYNIVS